MAGAVGIVFGLCVLSFTLGAALMYVLVRRREDAAPDASSPSEAPAERTWVEKPATVEPVDDDYDTRPIHRNAVVGLPQLEPALATLAEPESARDAEPVAAPKTVGAVGYDRDGDLDPPVGEVEAPESSVAASTDSPEFVEDALGVRSAEGEPGHEAVDECAREPADGESAREPDARAEPTPRPEPAAVPPPVAETKLPPPASPQPAEHTTWVEREDFRQRYLRTFEEVRRKAGSN